MHFKNYCFGLLYLVVTFVEGQMNPLYLNEYLSENYYTIHPAMAGVNLSGLKFDFGTRQQWMNSSQRPATQFFTLEYKTTPKTTLGLMAINDQNGYHNQYKYQLTYCYRIYLNDQIWKTRRSFHTKNDNIQELSFALNLGRSGMNLDQSSWNRPSQDPLLNQNLAADQYTTFDAGVAYVSTRLSVQLSFHNLAFASSNSKSPEEALFSNVGGNKIYMGALQYEIYTKKGWNYEPSFLYQYEEKTNESSLDMNFKVYKIIDDGRIWMGISRRQNNVKIRNGQGLNTNQNYKHWTLTSGLNYGKIKFGYQYTLARGEARFSSQGIHYIVLGFQI